MELRTFEWTQNQIRFKSTEKSQLLRQQFESTIKTFADIKGKVQINKLSLDPIKLFPNRALRLSFQKKT